MDPTCGCDSDISARLAAGKIQDVFVSLALMNAPGVAEKPVFGTTKSQ
jgi:hypothetical protein